MKKFGKITNVVSKVVVKSLVKLLQKVSKIMSYWDPLTNVRQLFRKNVHFECKFQTTYIPLVQINEHMVS